MRLSFCTGGCGLEELEGNRVKSIVEVVGLKLLVVPIMDLSTVSGPQTRSAPYLRASSREGSSPERTIGASTTLPR